MAAPDEITLDDVKKELSSVKNKWYQIGLFLKIDEEKLKSFKHKSGISKQGKSLNEVLSTYISTNSNPSWCTIAECLRSTEVGRPDLAEAIERKYVTASSESSIKGE